jgi:hypothetical protein
MYLVYRIIINMEYLITSICILISAFLLGPYMQSNIYYGDDRK